MLEDWQPGREVQLVAGTPPGGGQDRPARALIGILESQGLVTAPLRLVNVAGKGGGKAWDLLRDHPGDPHIIAINSPTVITNRLLGVADYDHAALTPLANLYTEYLVFAVRADSAIATPADILARFAADTAALRIAYATAVGNMNHIALAQVITHAGGAVGALNATVFDSARHACAHVVDGKAEMAVVTATSAVPELQAGTLRAIVLSAPARLSGPFAAAPTWREAGVDCVVGTWRGVIGPAGLDAAAIAFWDRALAAATASPAWKAELDRHHWSGTYLGSAATAEFLDAQRQLIGDALRALGLVR
ncbi:MAG TPA: tripartite tricarboxylate transporter substrate-binding protein [Roseomonas sp.]|jgi:putative tricarboxylic transport membrane protein